MTRTRSAVALLFVLCVACTATSLVDDPSNEPAATAPGPPRTGQPGRGEDPEGVGVDLVPIHVNAFIYGVPTMHPVIHSGTSTLAHVVSARDRLTVVGLPSAKGTAAIGFLETSPQGHLWGEALFPAERSVFRAFAANPSSGDFLVVLTDVEVLDGPDPVPLTAYRWARQDVEAFASCGIKPRRPNHGVDACTAAFYARADTRIVQGGGTIRGF